MPEPTPFRGLRKVIASRMLASLQSTAQLTYHCQLDVSSIVALLPEWKAQGHQHGLQDCLLFALARALVRHPVLNGTCDADGYTLASTIDINLALAAPTGLVTPVLRHVETLTLAELAAARRDLTGRAAQNGLAVSEMKAGTFTFSNLGLSPVEYFTPIINAPQIAILGVGKLIRRPMLDKDGGLIEQALVPLSLTADHRVVDGDPAGRFLTDLAAALRDTDWREV